MKKICYAKLKRTGLVIASTAGCIASAYSQDVVRPSLTEALAPENRTFTSETPKYNILAGPVSVLLDASMFVEYNDNVNLSDVNKQEDVIIRPQIGVTASWQLTDLNTLTLKVNAGYAYYVNNSISSNVTFAPGSELALNVYAGDFRIRFYDSFELIDSPVDNAGFSNVGDFGQFQNTAGVAVSWTMSNITATLGYNHNNVTSTTGDFDYLDNATNQVYGSAYYALSPNWGVGIEGAYGATRYDQSIQNDADSWHAGVFVEGTLSENFSFRAAVGKQEINFNHTSSLSGNDPSVNGLTGDLGADQSDFQGAYANIGFTHVVNAALTQELTIGREALLGINSNYIDLFYVRHTAQWNIVKDVDLFTRLFFEKSNESGSDAEDSKRYGFSVGANYQIAPSWLLSAEYGYIKKDSNLDERDYTQNRVVLGITYQF